MLAVIDWSALAVNPEESFITALQTYTGDQSVKYGANVSINFKSVEC